MRVIEGERKDRRHGRSSVVEEDSYLVQVLRGEGSTGIRGRGCLGIRRHGEWQVESGGA